MINIHKFKFNNLRESTYVAWEEKSKLSVIIDPGCSNNDEQKILTDFITQNQLIPTKIFNTHCHVDHVIGNAFCKRKYNIPIYIHEAELPMLQRAPITYQTYPFESYEHVEHDFFFSEDAYIGSTKFEIMHLPGHTPGCVAIFNREEKKCFTGDVLFNGHIGLTNLDLSDHEEMKKSLLKLMTLEDDMEVFPGHGWYTTIAAERENVKRYVE